jgi:hypothetical protein
MGYQNYEVVCNFNDGTNNYDLPHVQEIHDPNPGMKATVIHGTRGDGCLVIPGGKQSEELIIRGILFDADGYKDLTTLINEMKSKVTTDSATLTLKHKEGASFVVDWSYTVRRNKPIIFPNSDDMRTQSQPYEVRFLITSYS